MKYLSYAAGILLFLWGSWDLDFLHRFASLFGVAMMCPVMAKDFS